MSTILQPTSVERHEPTRPGMEQSEAAKRSSAGAVFLWWTVGTCVTGFVLAGIVLLVELTVGLSTVHPIEEEPAPVLFIAVPIGALAGAVSCQLVLLRRYVGAINRTRWLTGSLGGWFVSGFAIFVAHILWVTDYVVYGDVATRPETVRVAQAGWSSVAVYALPAIVYGLSAGAVGGLMLGAAQHLVLREHAPKFNWVLANTIALSLGGAAGMYTFGLFEVQAEAWDSTATEFIWLRLLSLALPTPISLLVVGLVTGIAMAWRLRRPSKGRGSSQYVSGAPLQP